MRQRPIESGGYEDNSVAAGTPGIDESVPPENRGAIPAEPYVTTGFRPAAGPLEPDPEADRATDPSSGSAAYRPPVVPPTLGSGPGLPEQAAYQRALVNSASFVLPTIRDMNQIRERNAMSPRHGELQTTISHPGGDVTRPGFNPPKHHTHVQHSCRCIHVDR